MNIKKMTTVLAVAMLFFYSCQQPVSELTMNEGPIVLSPGDSGKLTISVPLVSSALQKTLEKEIPTRAYLFAKKIVTILLDANGTIIDLQESTFPGGSLDDPGALISVEMDVPWGQNYSVVVQIQDNTLGNTTIVEGESALFDMGFDQVNVQVTLLPANPVVLDLPVSLTGTISSSVYGTTSFTSMGDEVWYELTPTHNEMAVFTVDSEGEALLFYADESGFFQGSSRENDPSQPTVLTTPLNGGETAYVGLIILDDVSVPTDYTLTYQSVNEGILKLNLSGMSAEIGSALMMDIYPEGSTERAASINSNLTNNAMSLYLFEDNGLNLWNGLGSYEYQIFIDRDGSGVADQNDLVGSGTINMTAGINELILNETDFALYSPDLSGLWYYVNDERDILPESKVMEVITLIEKDGTFTVYNRRHDIPTVDWIYIDKNDFLPVMGGTWSLDGYEMLATVERIDALTTAFLSEDIPQNYEILLPSYFGVPLPGSLGLKTREEVEAFATIFSITPEMLDATFQTYLGALVEETAALADGSGQVNLLGIDSEIYRLKDTYLGTNQSGDSEDFRTFTIENLPAEVIPFL